ncbi:MAG: hypothetical protein KJ597_05655, partial [Nanoarchaeota archaeon]|nr:hypothetical protein [Nanoarchaeota archaeon]MBU1623030.1 hypothetical protein [Nanoarchaeota archaeon]
AANYEAEFQEMWNGTFKKGEEVLNPQVNLGNITISSYFCPEDCKIQLSSTGQEVGAVYIISDLIRNAKESIYFMTFSFTHEKIGNAILLRHLEGNVTIKGIFESRGSGSEYSNYKVFEYQGIDVIKDKNPGAMHHKVFIIDEETVVTGSFNPSNNGENNNDENILIIKDKAIAQKYLEEFNRLYAEFS